MANSVISRPISSTSASAITRAHRWPDHRRRPGRNRQPERPPSVHASARRSGDHRPRRRLARPVPDQLRSRCSGACRRRRADGSLRSITGCEPEPSPAGKRTFNVVNVVHKAGRVLAITAWRPPARSPAHCCAVRTGQPLTPVPCLLLGQRPAPRGPAKVIGWVVPDLPTPSPAHAAA